jgi:FMN reductase
VSARRITVVSAGIGQPSSTRLLADRLAAATVRRLADEGIDTTVDVLELRDVAHDITNNLLAGFASPALETAIAAVTGADGVIAVTPVYTTSYSGLFKSFIDILDPQALAEMPVLLGATGGTERHSLALDYAMRPLFAYLHAVTVPTAVYAASADWGAGEDASVGSLPQRIERAAGEFAALVRASDRSSRIVDPFELPAGFDPSGAGSRGLSTVGAFGAE